jgi:hypothetical protein
MGVAEDQIRVQVQVSGRRKVEGEEGEGRVDVTEAKAKESRVIETKSIGNSHSKSGGPDALTLLECPICFEILNNACETVCGHAFCGKSLLLNNT